VASLPQPEHPQTSLRARLATLLERAADAFDFSASLAADHSRRLIDASRRPHAAAVGHERAEQARTAALRARSNAELLGRHDAPARR
jgi:hypothetical protein